MTRVHYLQAAINHVEGYGSIKEAVSYAMPTMLGPPLWGLKKSLGWMPSFRAARFW